MNSIFAGRECKGKYWVRGTSEGKGSYQEFDNATFLGFGDDYEEFESGPAQFTIAIVELPDGKVATTAPDFIQFVSKKRIKPDKPLTGSAGASEPADDEIPSKDEKDAQRDKEKAKTADKNKPKRKRVDHGKIRALKNAGWSNKDIADEMHMTPGAVANSLSTHKKLIEELKRI